MPRSTTLALSRKADAVTLFRQGNTFEQIARKVGFSHRGTAHRAVKTALKEHIVEDIEDYRRQEVMRLDAVQSELWDIMTSDAPVLVRIRASASILKVIDLRCKVLGLYDRPPTPPQMLVDPCIKQRMEGNICPFTDG